MSGSIRVAAEWAIDSEAIRVRVIIVVSAPRHENQRLS